MRNLLVFLLENRRKDETSYPAGISEVPLREVETVVESGMFDEGILSSSNLEARGRLHALKLLMSEADGICKLLAEYAGIPFVSGRSRLDITRSVTAGD